jgi:hypothetical protein
MPPELFVCIPGKWADRNDFLRQVITCEPKGRYMFAGMVLADIQAEQHVRLEFCPADSHIPEAFNIAGQGQLPADLISQLVAHTAVVYLRFPLDVLDQREYILKFTQLVQRVGGIAVKLESAGIAHTWDRWFALMSGSLFDVYCACVVLIGDERCYYSCGMHHFGLPECEAPRDYPHVQAADVMNRFNFWRITERPTLESGHTFSLSSESPSFRLSLCRDTRHGPDDLFHNSHGIWQLAPMGC